MSNGEFLAPFLHLISTYNNYVVLTEWFSRIPSFNALKGKNAHLKTVASVGGWNMGTDLFIKLVSSQSKIDALAANTVR